MTEFGKLRLINPRALLLLLLAVQITACSGQVPEKAPPHRASPSPILLPPNTTFPQIHSNLQGMVREFVRKMHQDKKGIYWFGTNGDGIIRYDGQKLEKVRIPEVDSNFRVLSIVEDRAGNVWFGTSEGLIKYDRRAFTAFPLQDEEVWGLAIDKNGLMWVCATGGVRQFNSTEFIPFSLPDATVENARPMLSSKLVFKIIEDRYGNMWFATDGSGIFKYSQGKFTHITTRDGLSDNNVADIFEDKQGNIWIGSFYGGVSKFDGKTYTHFTKDGTIAGDEAYNLYEDSHGNIWFTAEGYGVYRYDGRLFTQFTTENGLTSNVTLSIYEDRKGQIWFGSWQGISIFDGTGMVDAKEIEPWTNQP